MKPENAVKEFKKYLKSRELNSDGLTPSTGVEAMLSFYHDVRVDECDLEDGADQLLFQWGTYNWGKGENFEFDITRQLITGEAGEAEDDDIWQLHLTFKFSPDEKLSKLGKGNRWCHNLGELMDFTSFIKRGEPYTELAARLDADIELYYENAG